ncbi:MAG: carboxylesterase family protein [Dehalococcoidales bacterium]|nr:carboxylesterase family protein [Dehalococcoidales bacterium]
MDSNIVLTSTGKIRGYEQAGTFIHKGIPYAEPPVGKNRFAPPQPVKPWSGILEAKEYGPIAVQAPSPKEFSKLNLPIDEAHCLTLNIWTPGNDNKKRPVMFWIHGGSLAIGSGAEYDGQKLAARGDVVVVTINYRLNILGFLYVPGKTANVGMLDQIEALKWVNKNIEQFGGDPANITLFGESAGALSISVLMSMPRAKGLFKRVILESNACTSYHHKSRGGESVGQKVFSMLEKPYGDLDSLRDTPAPMLLKAYQKIELTMQQHEFYPPFVDGDTIPVHPLQSIEQGNAKDIEILAGYNTNEATLFSLWSPKLDEMTVPIASQYIAGYLQRVGKPGNDARTLQKMVDAYLNTSPGMSGRAIWERFLTDILFRIPLTRFVEKQLPHQSNVFFYEFAWKTPLLSGQMGATHALELHFVFDRFEETPYGIYPAADSEVEKISHAMMDAWVAFARRGNPNHAGIPSWQPYLEKRRSRMVFNKQIESKTAVLDEIDTGWQKII